MTATLEGGEWSASRPGRTLPPGKTLYPFYRLCGPQGWSGLAENLVPTGIRSRIVQPVAQSPYRLSSVTIVTELQGPYTLQPVCPLGLCARRFNKQDRDFVPLVLKQYHITEFRWIIHLHHYSYTIRICMFIAFIILTLYLWIAGYAASLQTGRTRDLLPMLSLKFFIDIVASFKLSCVYCCSCHVCIFV